VSSVRVKLGAGGAWAHDQTSSAAASGDARFLRWRKRDIGFLYDTGWGVSAAVLVVRILIGGLLLTTGILKVGHPAELAAAIAGFRLLPAGIVGPMALALPYFELLSGAYLLAGLFTRVVAIVAAMQFCLYGAAIGSALVRHIPANCGCFGPGDTAVADWPHVAFDLVLAAASVFIAYGAPGSLSVDRRLAARS
jgi:putative oxidoreductase